MIRRKRKLRDLDRRLREAQDEHRRVVREGKAQEPVLHRLEQHLKENRFVERLVLSLEQTRRRPT